MGAIVEVAVRQETPVVLKSEHLVGRRANCDLVLPCSAVSGAHATLRWSGVEWFVRDLGSRNGTFVVVAGRGAPLPVPRGEERVLALDDCVVFADVGQQWRVVNIARPQTLLLPQDLDLEAAVALEPDGNIVPVPMGGERFASVYLDLGCGLWQLELPDDVPRSIRDGEAFTIGCKTYTLSLPGHAGTAKSTNPPLGARVEDIYLEIVIAPDEESAELIVPMASGRVRSRPRAYLYLLSYLARRRVADESVASQGGGNDGWVRTREACDALCLSSVEQLAVEVFRCRKELERMGVANAARVVDRDRRGMLRIGIAPERLKVNRGV
ncbi:MAG: FHA domain-containing protein [Nannocystaceae bacterium]